MMPEVRSEVVAMANRLGLHVGFLESGGLGTESQVTRFVDACMAHAQDLSPLKQNELKTALTLGKIVSMATHLEVRAPSLFAVRPSFFASTDMVKVARGWILAEGTEAGTLARLGLDDELRLIIEPQALSSLETLDPQFHRSVRDAMQAIGMEKAPGADTHVFVTTPYEITHRIASVSSV
jgi:hypothetical protein